MRKLIYTKTLKRQIQKQKHCNKQLENRQVLCFINNIC